MKHRKDRVSFDIMASRKQKAAESFRSGHARRHYIPRKEIVHRLAAMDTVFALQSPRPERLVSKLCSQWSQWSSTCKTKSNQPSDAAYYDLTKQNKFLVKSVFDGKGNYLYHRDCICKPSV